ncbi:hypothetical protein MNBD_ALPHA12-2287 [hydrothermal vent metagenome]|uniref:Uncharacterized protein n=1 Tax=hydrothermal vent metagenome TaxID=652676 RepID=A0A3B0TQU8_9ZZZZ
MDDIRTFGFEYISLQRSLRLFGVAALILLVSACNPFGISIEQEVVNWAIANYNAACPCPFSLDSFGDQCGAQSAWTLKTLNAPVCYPSEVTSDMIAKFLAA